MNIIQIEAIGDLFMSMRPLVIHLCQWGHWWFICVNLFIQRCFLSATVQKKKKKKKHSIMQMKQQTCFMIAAYRKLSLTI